MDYETLVEDYKDMLHSLLTDFQTAYEMRQDGEQFQMYFTFNELRFMKELLEQKVDELDGRC